MTHFHSDEDIELVDAIYSAAAREIDLDNALRLFTNIQQDIGIGLFYHDPVLGELSSAQIVGASQEITDNGQAIFDTFMTGDQTRVNPLFEASIELVMAGDIVVSDEVMPLHELTSMPYYTKVLEPLKIRHSLTGLIGGSGQRWLSFATGRHADQQSYNNTHRQRASLFQRHMARAIRILELLDEAKEAQSIFENTLEKLPQGIMLINDARQITFCNGVASQLISDSVSLSDAGDRLVVGSTSHDRAKFDQWWNILVASQASDGACYSGSQMGPIWQIEVSRVGPENDRKTAGRRWMLTLKQRLGGDRLPPDYLIKRYGLTQSEANVCSYLCLNGDAVSTAKSMGLSPNTVRTHLKSAFRKTGTRNQVELALKITAGT